MVLKRSLVEQPREAVVRGPVRHHAHVEMLHAVGLQIFERRAADPNQVAVVKDFFRDPAFVAKRAVPAPQVSDNDATVRADLELGVPAGHHRIIEADLDVRLPPDDDAMLRQRNLFSDRGAGDDHQTRQIPGRPIQPLAERVGGLDGRFIDGGRRGH
jgi:hypothetical protein